MEALGLQGVANGRALVGSGCVLGDGCRGTHTGSIRGGWVVGEGGGGPGIFLSNSSRPGGLEC